MGFFEPMTALRPHLPWVVERRILRGFFATDSIRWLSTTSVSS